MAADADRQAPHPSTSSTPRDRGRPGGGPGLAPLRCDQRAGRLCRNVCLHRIPPNAPSRIAHRPTGAGRPSRTRAGLIGPLTGRSYPAGKFIARSSTRAVVARRARHASLRRRPGRPSRDEPRLASANRSRCLARSTAFIPAGSAPRTRLDRTRLLVLQPRPLVRSPAPPRPRERRRTLRPAS